MIGNQMIISVRRLSTGMTVDGEISLNMTCLKNLISTSKERVIPTTIRILRYVWEKDSTGNLINTDDRKYDNAYQRILSFVKCYERNGVASENDHNILLISEDEISNFSDLLRDGDYVWIVESVDA